MEKPATLLDECAAIHKTISTWQRVLPVVEFCLKDAVECIDTAVRCVWTINGWITPLLADFRCELSILKNLFEAQTQIGESSFVDSLLCLDRVSTQLSLFTKCFVSQVSSFPLSRPFYPSRVITCIISSVQCILAIPLYCERIQAFVLPLITPNYSAFCKNR